MKEKNFRVSDSDFSAYLLSIGYKPVYIEVKEDKKQINKYKAFVHFEGDKNTMISLQKLYELGDIEINLRKFSSSRQEINRLVKSAIRIYTKTS